MTKISLDINLKIFNSILERIDSIIDKEKYNYSFNMDEYKNLTLLIFLKNKIITPNIIIKIYNLKTLLSFDVIKNDNQSNKSYFLSFCLDFKDNSKKSVDEKALNKILNKLQTFLINNQ